ncbi:MAG: hypothetical protein AUJ57_05015 [Zetaproteobacteria bacterium CG1_02_53_45]|nr:MAG: hypothetical protein AUJ57_05015 [Zetaproteobacteria bacterium CG1_02_53_45]
MAHNATTIAWIRGNPLFKSLSETAFTELVKHSTVETFTSGELLIAQNSQNKSLYLITHGQVKIIINDTEVDSQQAGETVGEISMSHFSPPVADVVADGDVETVAFPMQVIDRLCAENTDFAAQLRKLGMKKVYDR